MDISSALQNLLGWQRPPERSWTTYGPMWTNDEDRWGTLQRQRRQVSGESEVYHVAALIIYAWVGDKFRIWLVRWEKFLK